MALHEVTAQGDFDLCAVRDAIAGPGADTRQWVSFGLVEPMTEGSGDQAVEFDTELGPLVSVTLQPSGLSVVCRVAGWCAGALEAEYYPFQVGDEVICVVPEGDERTGVTIIGRLNNSIDAWPGAIAGQDATQNNLAFRRIKAPYTCEFANSYMLRSGNTGSLLSFTPAGNVTLSDSSGNYLSMSGDNVTLSSGDTNEMIQFDVSQGTLYLQGGLTSGSIMQLADTSGFFSAGTFSFNTFGNPAVEHATSTEAVLNILNILVPLVMQALATAMASVPPATNFPGGGPFSTAVLAAFNQAAVVGLIKAMLAQAPAASIAAFLTDINPALNLKPGDPSGNFPNVGSPGLLIG